MRYDIPKLKAEINDLAAKAHEAKAKRREVWRVFSAVERERSSLKDDRNTIDDWWKRRGKALNIAQGATCEAACIATTLTVLYSIRAHLRGRLHMRRERLQDGRVVERTLEDQARLIEDRLDDFMLPETPEKVA